MPAAGGCPTRGPTPPTQTPRTPPTGRAPQSTGHTAAAPARRQYTPWSAAHGPPVAYTARPHRRERPRWRAKATRGQNTSARPTDPPIPGRSPRRPARA
eukprot:4819817-Alexandrium_andersonii.AAC.1